MGEKKRKITIEITEEQYRWLKKNPWINLSGLVRKAIDDMMLRNLTIGFPPWVKSDKNDNEEVK